MATNENKTPGIILSPAQGVSKPEAKPATVHVNAREHKATVVGTEFSVSKYLLEPSTPEGSTTEGTENETMGDLAGKIEVAQSQGIEWVETTVSNICKLRKKEDWVNQGYFCHKGVKICHFGESKKIEERESKTVHDRMHPESKTVVVSG